MIDEMKVDINKIKEEVETLREINKNLENELINKSKPEPKVEEKQNSFEDIDDLNIMLKIKEEELETMSKKLKELENQGGGSNENEIIRTVLISMEMDRISQENLKLNDMCTEIEREWNEKYNFIEIHFGDLEEKCLEVK